MAISIDFSADVRIGKTPLEVVFTPQVSGDPIVSYTWQFGDGTISSEESPTHTYNSVGSFTVTLSVVGETETASLTKTTYISVIKPEFSASDTIGFKPLNVKFYDETAVPSGYEAVAWSWDFGDETPSSVTQDSAHTYEKAGQYYVKLDVTVRKV